MSVKELLKAESYLQSLPNIEYKALSQPQNFRPPIVETYINLGNAYLF